MATVEIKDLQKKYHINRQLIDILIKIGPELYTKYNETHCIPKLNV